MDRAFGQPEHEFEVASNAHEENIGSRSDGMIGGSGIHKRDFVEQVEQVPLEYHGNIAKPCKNFVESRAVVNFKVGVQKITKQDYKNTFDYLLICINFPQQVQEQSC